MLKKDYKFFLKTQSRRVAKTQSFFDSDGVMK